MRAIEPRTSRCRRTTNYGGEFARKRTEQSFLVPKADIAAQAYDLSINRYKEVVHDEVDALLAARNSREASAVWKRKFRRV